MIYSPNPYPRIIMDPDPKDWIEPKIRKPKGSQRIPNLTENIGVLTHQLYIFLSIQASLQHMRQRSLPSLQYSIGLYMYSPAVQFSVYRQSCSTV